MKKKKWKMKGEEGRNKIESKEKKGKDKEKILQKEKMWRNWVGVMTRKKKN